MFRLPLAGAESQLSSRCRGCPARGTRMGQSRCTIRCVSIQSTPNKREHSLHTSCKSAITIGVQCLFTVSVCKSSHQTPPAVRRLLGKYANSDSHRVGSGAFGMQVKYILQNLHRNSDDKHFPSRTCFTQLLHSCAHITASV